MKEKTTVIENKIPNKPSEKILRFAELRIIEIDNAQPHRAYVLFDSDTGAQIKNFLTGFSDVIIFKNLKPEIRYDVEIIEGMYRETPQFEISWTSVMRDDTDTLLDKSGCFPVEYPYIYTVKGNNNDFNNNFKLTDENNNLAGQAIRLVPQVSKLKFVEIRTFKAINNYTK